MSKTAYRMLRHGIAVQLKILRGMRRDYKDSDMQLYCCGAIFNLRMVTADLRSLKGC
jgi:hypothetical protein